jgi:N-methylhydantoinase A/oxoprolinase/acetone carboxylase beta subunit/N-methylhydantoinase B/oxoprolinase/acetone carboxylase alpha subunit
MTERNRLAVDIGGTFTDLALEHPGGLATIKVLTTPHAPEEGVMNGVRSLLSTAALAASDIQLIIHGTTLATNALIERKGARTALVTTEGFRDVLALRNESRYHQYDLDIVLPEPLVPRHLRLTVPERIDRRGRVLLPLDEAAVRSLVPRLASERVESIAVGFLHGFVDPTHERRAAAILAEALPEIPISLASDVSPEMREWERFSTAAANAYVQPLMASYLRRLEHDLREIGIAAPILMMLSGGNLTTIETACRFPIRLVESGPAGGAIFSASVARQCGLEHALSFDMGGTTAKVCMIDDFAPQASRTFEVARVGRFKKGSGLPLRIPVIEMVEIGAGGGSLAHVDGLGRITVGPESAGADPGPACYGRGGAQPAVTDANLTLGRYDPERFAGGALSLDPEAAEAALVEMVGRPLGLDAGMAALGVIEMVDENMANAARVHAVESGKTSEGRTLIAFGGGGPVHAARIAEKLGITRVLAPSGAGVGSAIGFLRAPVGYEVVRSLYQRLGSLDLEAINALLAAMAAEAASVVAQGSFGAPTQEKRLAYMRYVGQGHEIAVPLPARPLGVADAPEIRAGYDAEYSRLYSRPAPASDIEVISFAVTVATLPPPREERLPPPSAFRPEPSGRRKVRDTATGIVEDWTIYDRALLRPGAVLEGPAIVAEAETSTLIGAGWRGAITAEGHVEMVHAAAALAEREAPLTARAAEAEQTRSATASAQLAAIQKPILWNRLIAVVEEQAQTMIRTAFSTTVREAGDLSAGVFDLEGRMLAQAVTGTPGHVNSMMESVGHFLSKFPAATMREGDHYITNDPWLGTGHLHDLTVVSPAFRNGRIVGLFANTAHVIDIGGLGMGPEGRSVFEEGLYIPILKCFDAGRPNETFFEFLRYGSRLPIELEGDVYSLCACNDAGARQLVRLMDEFAMDSLDPLAEFIFDSSLRATRAEIAKMPKGVWSSEISSDGYEAPVTLRAALTVREDVIEVDFAGTSGLSTRGINVPTAYCRAYAAFGIKVVVAPEVPNNWASLAPFRFAIPEGSILNAPRPYPVSVRHVIGQLLPDLMMGCLSQAVPDRVAAEGSSCLWNPPLRGGGAVSGQASGNRRVLPDFEVITFNSGGTGARRKRDGLDGTAFPSGVRTMPVEATENFAPVIFWRKELLPDSGGPGRTRGGLGQIMEIGGEDDLEFACNAVFDRISFPPKGRDGGGLGAAGRVELKSGPALRAKGFQVIPDGERLVLRLPGGGGMGDATTRDPALVATDVRDGLVSPESAEQDYRVMVRPDGEVDEAGTARLRGRG